MAGYRVFSREEGQSYDYTNPLLEIAGTSCNINNLDENKTYYFVIRAFDTKGFESGDSNEEFFKAATTPNNQAPVADAGSDQTIILPADTVVLDATCTDDGLPNGTLNSQWRQVSGPGTVTFGDTGAEDTTARFPTSGLYVLRFTADDNEFSTSDDIQVTVSAGPINLAPVVNAGNDQTITLPVDNVLLKASVTDDGLPTGVLTTGWSQLSGPANQVVFDNAYAIQTTATFLSAGTYILQLTADDGELTADTQVTVNVTDAGSSPPSTCILDSQFQQAILSGNNTYYTDRDYELTSIPSKYIGMDMIKTPNDDRNLTAASDYLTFEMPYDGIVYVAFDSRASSLPGWMIGFSNTGERIYTSLSSQPYLNVYQKSYSQDDCVNFGANKAPGFSGDVVSNYMVFW